MEEFSYAGGVPAVLKEISPLLHLEALTARGKAMGENLGGRSVFNARSHPASITSHFFRREASLSLNGNLAPLGAVIKQSAVSAHLMKHRGRAVVFASYAEYMEKYNDLNLDVRPNDILVLQSTGPKGYPGMPEYGSCRCPCDSSTMASPIWCGSAMRA